MILWEVMKRLDTCRISRIVNFFIFPRLLIKCEIEIPKMRLRKSKFVNVFELFLRDHMGIWWNVCNLIFLSFLRIYKKLKKYLFKLIALDKNRYRKPARSDEETIFCMILNGIEAIKMQILRNSTNFYSVRSLQRHLSADFVALLFPLSFSLTQVNCWRCRATIRFS
jgi:hypothetical protein